MNSSLPRLLSVFVLLAACGGPPTSGDVSLELGTGESEFAPLVDYQEAPLVAGPQGGHHVWISFRAEGLSSDRVLMDLEMIPLDTTEPPARGEPVRVFMTVHDEEHQSFVGWPAQILHAGCYVGVPLSVRVELTDPAGNVAVDERIVVPTSDQTLECDR